MRLGSETTLLNIRSDDLMDSEACFQQLQFPLSAV